MSNFPGRFGSQRSRYLREEHDVTGYTLLRTCVAYCIIKIINLIPTIKLLSNVVLLKTSAGITFPFASSSATSAKRVFQYSVFHFFLRLDIPRAHAANYITVFPRKLFVPNSMIPMAKSLGSSQEALDKLLAVGLRFDAGKCQQSSSKQFLADRL